MAVSLKVNGTSHNVPAEPDTPLLYVLRNDLALNGAKFGCGLAQCGACTVLVDGKAVRSCVTDIGSLAGAEITTLEGLGTADKPHPLRAIAFGDPQVSVERRDDGTIYLRPKVALGDYPVRLTDRLHHWADLQPHRVFMAERDADGGWRQITYAELLNSARRIGSALLARDLSADP